MLFRAVAALILILTVAGCTAPGPTALPSSEPKPPATASPNLEPAVTQLVLGTKALEFVADDGTTLTRYDWFDDPTVVIDALTKLFGSAPQEVPHAGNPEEPPSIGHEWGGFSIIVSEGQPQPPAISSVRATTTISSLAGIAIRTPSGITTDSSATDVEAVVPSGQDRMEFEGHLWVWHETDPELVPSPYDPATDATISVLVRVDLNGDGVDFIAAPAHDLFEH